jgi:Cys-tRNA(Pro) deacylase
VNPWPEPVERVAAFLREAGAEARLDEYDADTATAEAAADAIGCTLGQVVKTLVVFADTTPVVALVPGDRRLDTGKLAALTGARRVSIAQPDDVIAVTGFPPGAVAPFPLATPADVIVERVMLRHPRLWIGAGSTRHMVSLEPLELVRLTRGRLEAIALESA